VHYHPDDTVDLRLAQEQKVLELWQATRASGHELLLEIICPAGVATDVAPDAAVLRAIQRFYNLGIRPEWWKLAPLQAAGWQALEVLVRQRDPQCRGAVILGLNQPIAALADSFSRAQSSIVRGFMVGRSVWADASQQWLGGQIDDQALVDSVAGNFTQLVLAWRNRAAAASAPHPTKAPP
jgi:5-dehydro-2-deoxygluconokinase